MIDGIISPKMALRPRLVIDLTGNDLNYALRALAAQEKTTLRKVVLQGLMKAYPQLDELIEAELRAQLTRDGFV